jgi:hypothetical protein
MIMQPEPLAALANFTESVLNMGFDFFGFEAPQELREASADCIVPGYRGFYSVEALYSKFYSVNISAYNGRYAKEPDNSATPPAVDFAKCCIHERLRYEDGHYVLQPWHFKIAKLLDFWLYQTDEDATRKNEFRLGVQILRDSIYGFIVQNSTDYNNAQWGRL